MEDKALRLLLAQQTRHRHRREGKMVWRLWLAFTGLAALCLLALGVAVQRRTHVDLTGTIASAGLLVWISTSAASYWLARRLLRPLEDIRRGAERFGRGELSVPIDSPTTEELARLADALNGMAAQLDERFAEITRQRNEREAILGSMKEGLLAIDSDERVLAMNCAAAEILGVDADWARGRLVQEVIRIVELQRYIGEALRGRVPEREDGGTHINAPGSVVLRTHSAPLRDGDGNEIGLLVLVENVTRLNRLESLRRDFVANVSHELRTPVAGIKGYAETLLDGALEDPANARRFVEVILRQSDRLDDLVKDLLSLSRLENMDGVSRESTRVCELLANAVEVCQRVAEQRGAKVQVICPEELMANVSPQLLEQAVINLLENAIKYGGNPPEVRIEAHADAHALVLLVTDKGPGISPEHHERLFERFYRVDKARNRAVGGTGLGLAIVKHVAQAHGGAVRVQSRIGQGSTFILRLPDAV
jgi:two-component system phosphate regulon sensor histidine kinase PhoR